ncbi:MAG: aminotransferase class I/II-fold pyridoxal phosphate-dependent enzyme [Halobacteriota archaeon]
MDVPPFELERFFAEYEHEADIMLAESGIRSLPADRFDLDPGPLGYVIPTNGDPELRAEIGERYGRNPEEVLLTVGTQEANFVLFQSLLSPDDHAVVVTPTYQALHSLPATIADVTRVDLEPPEWTLDVDQVAAAIRPETELIVINNPNNPTGRYHDPETIEALYDLAADNDAYLHADEVYRLLAPDPNPPVASLGPHGISTAGLTKAYGLAGLRFGWLVADEAVIDAAWRWKDYTTISPSKIGQHVARQALGEQEADILAENRALAARNRDIVRDFLDAHDLDWFDPVGVNGFVEVPPGFEGSESFCREFVEQESVVLAPGAAFGFDGYVRIGFGLPTAELREGLARLETFLDGR